MRSESRMSVDQASPLVPITPQLALPNNSFVKNSHNRSSFCGVPTTPNGTGFGKSFASNRKSWNGNGTLPLQYSTFERDILDGGATTPELATFKSNGTLPRNLNNNGSPKWRIDNGEALLTPNGNTPLFTNGTDFRRSVGSSSGRRYAEIGNWGNRSSTFLEPHIQGVGVKRLGTSRDAASSSESDGDALEDAVDGVPGGADDERALLRRPARHRRAHQPLHNQLKPTPIKQREIFDKIENCDPLISYPASFKPEAAQMPMTRATIPAPPVPAPRILRPQHQSTPNRPADENLNRSGESLSTSSAAGGSSSSADESECGSEASCHSGLTPCDLGLLERLIRSHPVWFLPGIQRAGAFHLLQGKEEGNFVVRQSSQADTMAISVRLPPNKGPYIEHYLIQATSGHIALETSQNKFNNIPELIAHYSQCCDELPVQLSLPRALKEAKNRQALSSLALLGQEFWRYPMANPKQQNGVTPVPTPSDTASSQGTNGSRSFPNLDSDDSNVVLNLTPLDVSNSSGNTPLSTFKGRALVTPPQNNINLNGSTRAPRPTPPNTLNLMSSTADITHHPHSLLSPQGVTPTNNIIKCTPPPPPPRWTKPPFPTSVSSEKPPFTPMHKSGNITVTTTVTFSVNNPTNGQELHGESRLTPLPNSSSNNNHFHMESGDAIGDVISSTILAQNLSRRLSPEGECVNVITTPLNNSLKRQFNRKQSTGDSSPTRTALSPEPSAKNGVFSPSQMTSPNESNSVTSGIFSPTPQINSPNSNATISSKSGVFSPGSKSELFSPLTRSSPMSTKSIVSPISNQSFTNQSSFNSPLMGKDRERILSPNTNTVSTAPSGRSRRSKHSLRKESRHYQESDILESPGVYYRSSVGDKISDYEDIWGPEHNGSHISSVSSFKPIKLDKSKLSSGDLSGCIMMSKRPDLLPDTLPKVTSLNNNVLSPGSPPLTDNDSDKEQDAKLANCNNINNLSNRSQQYNEKPNLLIATTNSKGEIVPKRPDKLNLSRSDNADLNNDYSGDLKSRDDLLDTQMDEDKAENKEVDAALINADEEQEKQGSPFYADPVDAIKESVIPPVNRRRLLRVGVGLAQRYSEPPNNLPYYPLREMNSIEELSPSSPNTSTSVDNLISLRLSKPKVKAVLPPRINNGAKKKDDTTWTVDSSWEFIGKHEDGSIPSESGTFPSLAEQESRLGNESSDAERNKLTVHQIIAERFPELRLSPALPMWKDGASKTSVLAGGNTTGNVAPSDCDLAEPCRTSCYDNVEGKQPFSSRESDDGTVFSEPWDCSKWDGLIPPDDSSVHTSMPFDADEDDRSTIRGSISVRESAHDSSRSQHPAGPTAPLPIRTKSFRERLDPLLAPPRIQALRGCRNGRESPGAAVRAYALHLAADKSTTFAQNIDNFISCTRDSKEICPQIVMRNMRQFMSGMKNYLVKHGEREFEKEVEKERLKLKSHEFLNLDAILEGVMHRLVVRPLRSHLYVLLADWHASDVRTLAASIKQAFSKSALEVGVKPSTTVPTQAALTVISKHFVEMQEADSPLDKLESLLSAISAIFNSMKSECAVGADDLLPVLVWVLVRCRLVGAELEAELMGGLLPPALLAGEGGYYLTTLFSAVAVLKRFKSHTDSERATLRNCSSGWGSWCGTTSLSAGSGAVIVVALPDENRGALRKITLPSRPGAKTKDLCRAVAITAAITNPQDYALVALTNGHETMLTENDCPEEFLSEKRGRNCILAYKRIDAKIAWPKQALQSYP